MDGYVNNYELGEYTIVDLIRMTKDEVKEIYEHLPSSQPCSDMSKKRLIWCIFLHYYCENREDVPRPIVQEIRVYLKV
jgi:hypothetical protein